MCQSFSSDPQCIRCFIAEPAIFCERDDVCSTVNCGALFSSAHLRVSPRSGHWTRVWGVGGLLHHGLHVGSIGMELFSRWHIHYNCRCTSYVDSTECILVFSWTRIALTLSVVVMELSALDAVVRSYTSLYETATRCLSTQARRT